MDIFSYLLGRKYKDSNTGSGSGANITSNIKIVANKSSVLSSSHNKLCIVNELEQGLLKEIPIPELKDISYNLYLTYKNDTNKVVKNKLLTIIRNIKKEFPHVNVTV